MVAKHIVLIKKIYYYFIYQDKTFFSYFDIILIFMKETTRCHIAHPSAMNTYLMS